MDKSHDISCDCKKLTKFTIVTWVNNVMWPSLVGCRICKDKSSVIAAAAKSRVVGEAVHVGHSAFLHSHGGPLLQRVKDLNEVAVIPLVNRSAGFSSVGQ